MFLFSVTDPSSPGEPQTTLHTGDFRFSASMKLFPALASHVDGGRRIDRLVLDTTFADESSFPSLPSKEQSQRAITELINTVSKTANVEISCQALGLEELFLSIRKELGEKVLVSKKKLAMFTSIAPELEEAITDDPKYARIRICSKFSKVSSSPPPLRIKAGVMWSKFFELSREGSPKPVLSDGCWHVLYSTHSSWSELREFTSWIKPREIVPLVPCNAQSLQKLRQLCSASIPKRHRTSEGNRSPPTSPPRSRRETFPRSGRGGSDSEDDDGDDDRAAPHAPQEHMTTESRQKLFDDILSRIASDQAIKGCGDEKH